MKTKKYIFSLLALCISASMWAAEGGKLTSDISPIDPSKNVTLTYDGTGTNFANWDPKCYVHIWCLDANGELLYTTDWEDCNCNGDGDYENLAAKLKMTQKERGIYTITLNIQSFFEVPSNELGNIAKLGIIVRAQYPGDNNQTKNFYLDVALPLSCTEPVIMASTTSFSAEVNTSLTLSGISVMPSCSYAWTATGGTLTDATTLTPTFTASSAGTYTLTLTATDGSCSTTEEFTVTVEEESLTSYTYYFNNTGNWTKVYAYVWHHDTNGNTKMTGSWPGTEMVRATACSTTWYSITFAASKEPTHIIFNNNSGTQTEDIVIDSSKGNYWNDPEPGRNGITKGYWQQSCKSDDDIAYSVSFGVIDNEGGTLTAVSDNRSIKSGDAVTYAVFTAVPGQGYTVEGWYSDVDATSRIEEAGEATTYYMTVTEDNNDVYVKFRQVDAVYFKKNGLVWNNVYVYTFSANPWEDDKGVHPQEHRLEFGQMTKVKDDIYTMPLNYTDLAAVTFSKDDQSTYNDLWNTEAVHRGDFNSAMPLFVHEQGGSAKRLNEVNYYNEGIWMKYNSTSSGYSLMLRDAAGNEKAYPFTAAVAGGFTFNTVVPARAGTAYTFYVKNDKGDYFSVGNNAEVTGNEAAYRLYSWNNWTDDAAYVTFTPTTSGNYTVYLYLEAGKVVIGFGEEPGSAYRLAYVERTGDSKKVFHPSHYINTHSRATAENPVNDTVSLHVRPMVKNTDGEESANPQTCEVWLQREDQPDTWTTVQTIDVKTDATIAGNGVYNFVIEQRGGTNVSISDIHPYTGTFYIRSDAAKLTTGDVKGVAFDNLNYVGNLGNRLLYSEYAHNNETFDYYYCQWTTKGTNVKFTVANLYSYCIADTLVQNTYEAGHNLVETNGKLVSDANMRFMWNSYDNTLDRAYLAGAGENVQLLSRGGVYDINGNEQYKICLKDRQNWVYSADVLVDANALIKVYAPYKDIPQYFKGAAGEYVKPNVYPLITGTEGKQYKIRIIYDFKTNHLICAWLVGGLEITANDEIATDLMILRRNDDEAEQLTFDPNAREIAQVKNAYCVLSITKEYLERTDISSKQKSVYWVTFPFDVLLSEVFGGGMEYGNDYMIQYYDGAARAKNGCWSDSPTYWKYYEERGDIRLKKGLGYVVVIDWQRISERFFYAGNTEVALYFPSANTRPMTISGEITPIEIPAHLCTIERDNRYIYDSNWNLIGAPSFANVDEFGNPMQAKMIGDYQVGFLYEYDFATNRFDVSAADKVEFKSMYSYMVQFAGTVDWMEKTSNGTVVPEALRARRTRAENDVRTLCLRLERNGSMCDRTYVRFQEEGATAAFDLNVDLTKQDNAGVNLYTLTEDDLIRVAANVQPVPSELKTVSVGVAVATAGDYTFALPEGTEGMSVTLLDRQSGIRTNLLVDTYTVPLQAGTFEQRFVLEVNPKQHIITAEETVGSAGNRIRKYVIDGQLYIQKGNRLYDVQGREVKTSSEGL